MIELIVLIIVLLSLVVVSTGLDVRYARRGVFPLFSFISLFYFAFYGLFSTYQYSLLQEGVYHRTYWFYVEDISTVNIFAVAGFVLAQLVGIYVAIRLLATMVESDRQEGHSLTDNRAYWIAGGSLCVHLAFLLFPDLRTVPSFSQLYAPTWYFGFGVFSLIVFSGGAGRIVVGGYIVLFTAKTLFDLSQGFLTPIGLNLLILAAAAMFCRRWKLLVFAGVLFALSLPSYAYVKHLSRTVIHGQDTTILGFEPRLSTGSLTSSFNAVARRSSHTLLFEFITRQTPDLIPFGDTNPVVRAFTNHIPRAAWPSKPKERAGNEFGKKYGIVDLKDDVTSWNVPWVVDFYLNSGYKALALYGIPIGLSLGCLLFFFSRARDRAYFFGLYSAVLLPLCFQDSNFSVMTGNVMLVTGLYVVLFMALGKFQRIRSPGRQQDASR